MTAPVDVPPITFDNFMEHKIQKAVEEKISDQLPLKAFVIRAVNQFYYSVFGTSYMGGDNRVIVGKDGYLFSQSYLTSYCDYLRWPTSDREIRSWTDELVEVSRWLESQGKTLIYMTTPSKAAYYPEFLPSAYQCREERRRGPFKRTLASLHATNEIRIAIPVEKRPPWSPDWGVPKY